MRKTIIIIVVILLSLQFLACQAGRDEPKYGIDPNDITEPYGHLSEYDFSIYEDGFLIRFPHDFVEDVYRFSKPPEPPFLIKTLETKRGIKIGSSFKELVSAYSDIRCGVAVQDLRLCYNDINDFVYDLETGIKQEYPYGPGLIIVAFGFNYLNGECLNHDEFAEYAESLGLKPDREGRYDIAIEGIDTYLLEFAIVDGAVYEIAIAYL